MKIDIRAKECLYVEMNDWTYYIDDSTNEQIIEKWLNGTEADDKYGYDLTNKLYRFKELSPELQVALISYINSIASCSGLLDETKLRNHLEEETESIHEESRRELAKQEIVED